PAKRRAILTALDSVEPIVSGDRDSNEPAARRRLADDEHRGRSASRLRSGYVSADPSQFDRLARGYSYREIARAASMSPTTVARIAVGLPVRPAVLRRAATALSRLHADPSLAALLRADEQVVPGSHE